MTGHVVPSIGTAEGVERNGRADRYRIHEVSGNRLYVSHTGHREGTVVYGLPLGGPSWTPPLYVWIERSHFASVALNEPESMPAVCGKCGKPIERTPDGDDWTAAEGTTCGADVEYDTAGDPIIGHHEPEAGE